MAFESFSEFLSMKGHGLYVWLAYGVGLAVLIFNWIAPGLRKKQIARDIQQQIRREENAGQERNA
ncbi:MAG: heme exporter protein CcmD [Gammaproteobacteria bacterium]|nr:MAG: heme exporter protein CcmD [Gammaproteobacteria bacterium]